MLHPSPQFFFGANPAFRYKLFCEPLFFAAQHPPRAQKGVSSGHSFWSEKKRLAAKGFPLQSGLKRLPTLSMINQIHLPPQLFL